MKTIDAIWFSNMDGTVIGIVIGEDELTKKRKAYIGVGKGINEQVDTEYIKDYGTGLHLTTVKLIAKMLRGK